MQTIHSTACAQGLVLTQVPSTGFSGVNAGSFAEVTGPSSGLSQSLPLSSTDLATALQAAQAKLQQFATDGNLDALNLVFGDQWNQNTLQSLLEDWKRGDFSNLPEIDLLTGVQMNGANGAYSSTTNTIYLSKDLLTNHAGQADIITNVLLEEIGHAVDALINTTDAAGDEGDLFQRVVQNASISEIDLFALKTEDDSGAIALDGKIVNVEMSRVAAIAFNGRLYQSIRGTDNQVYVRSSTDGQNWSAWVGNGSTLASPEFEIFNNRLYQAIRGTDNQIYTRRLRLDGVTWSEWRTEGGTTLATPEMEAFNGRLYQTIRGTDDQVYIRSTADGLTWTTWEFGNGATLDTPKLETFNGRLYQTIRGTDNEIYTRRLRLDGVTWSAWQASGGRTLDAPEMEAFNGRLYQVVRGTDNQVYLRSTADGNIWTGWAGAGSSALETPELIVFNGRLHQTIRGTDSQAYTSRLRVDGTWSPWVANNSTLSTPTFTVFNNRLFQMIEGTDSRVRTRSSLDLTGLTWNTWRGGAGISTFRELSTVDLSDFNNDNKSDVLWRGSDGKVILWLDKDHTKRVEIGQIGDDFTFQGIGDFNADGNVDIMWRKNTGEIHAWYMRGIRLSHSEVYGGHDASATVQGFADLNRDRKTDVIWRFADGTITAWYDKDPTQRSVLGTVSADWTFQGTGDFNADGNIDLMWRKNTGEVHAWYMNNTQVLQSELYGGYDPSATLLDFADLNQDRRTDVIWRLADGSVVAWYDKDHTQRSGLGNINKDWIFQRTGDFNSDGSADLMWRKNTGEVAVWHMNRTQFRNSEIYGGYLSNVQMLIGTPVSIPPSLPPILSPEEFANWINWAEYTTRNPFPDKGMNCTWYAHGRAMQLGYSEFALDSMWGNAGTWDDTASRGATVSSQPQIGAIALWEAGVGGAGSVGHVAIVERVNSDGTILISESNWAGRAYNLRTISATNPSKFIIVPKA